MPKKNNDEIYTQLHNKIILLELKPGQQITETEIANMFGVSRTPIREAYRKLHAAGLIEIRPKTGAFVTLINVNEISDMLYMREKLELTILRDIERLNEAQIINLRINLAEQKNIVDNYDGVQLAQQFLTVDNQMHEYFFFLANRPNIWKRISKDAPHYTRLRILSNLQDKAEMRTLYNQHQEIVEALIVKDYERMDRAFKEHLYSGVRDLSYLVMKNRSYFQL